MPVYINNRLTNSPKNNFTADRTPTTSDNASQGYDIGSRWVYSGAGYTLTEFDGTDAVWLGDVNTNVDGNITDPVLLGDEETITFGDDEDESIYWNQDNNGLVLAGRIGYSTDTPKLIVGSQIDFTGDGMYYPMEYARIEVSDFNELTIGPYLKTLGFEASSITANTIFIPYDSGGNSYISFESNSASYGVAISMLSDDMLRIGADVSASSAQSIGVEFDEYLGNGLEINCDVGFFNTTPVGQQTVTMGNVNGEIGGLTISASYSRSEVQALRNKCEELADDVRNLHSALQAYGLLT